MKSLFALSLAFALLLSIGQLTRIAADGHTMLVRPLDHGSAAPGDFDGSMTVLATTRTSDQVESPLGTHCEERSCESARRTVPALVFPAHRVRLRAAASGTIRELLVEVGEPVSAGQVLCHLRPDEILADLRRSTAAVAAAGCRIDEAKADLELAEFELELKRKLSRAHATPKAEFEASRLRVRLAAARLESARQELNVAKHESEMVKERLERYRLVAPAEGRVTEILGHVDQYVREGDTLLWIESHAKQLKVHLPAEGVRGRHRIEVPVLAGGEWRLLGGGAPEPRDNPDGTVTVVFDLGPAEEFVVGQHLQVDSASIGNAR